MFQSLWSQENHLDEFSAPIMQGWTCPYIGDNPKRYSVIKSRHCFKIVAFNSCYLTAILESGSGQASPTFFGITGSY